MQGAFSGGAKSSKETPRLGCCGGALTQGQMVLFMDGEACLLLYQEVRQAWGLGFRSNATGDLCTITSPIKLPLVKQTVVQMRLAAMMYNQLLIDCKSGTGCSSVMISVTAGYRSKRAQ